MKFKVASGLFCLHFAACLPFNGTTNHNPEWSLLTLGFSLQQRLVPRFLYAVSQTTISMYSVDELTGSLSALSPASVAYGTSGGFIYADPSFKFFFVDEAGPNTFTFAMDQSTGNLTKIATANIGGNANPYIIHPTGRFAYGTINGSTTINIYSYDSATGGVTPINTATNTAAANTQSLLLDSTGRFFYTSNQGSSSVSQFAIDSTTGNLTSLGAPVAATQSGGLCTDSQNRWLYSVNTGAANIAGFTIQANGSLVTMGATFPVPAVGINCLVSADDRFLFLGAGLLRVLPINQTTGALGAAVSYSSGTHLGLAMDIQGRYLFASSNISNNVRSYRIDSGVPTLISTVPAGTQAGPLRLANLYVN